MAYRFFKRFFDVVCALIGIIGTSPLWIIGIVGILVSDWGPIFYTAHRIGKDNKPFKMYKFRSMRVLREARAGAEASLRPEEDRIFPFGHFTYSRAYPFRIRSKIPEDTRSRKGKKSVCDERNPALFKYACAKKAFGQGVRLPFSRAYPFTLGF